MPDDQDAPKRSTYVQAVPIFLRSDTEVASYFQNHRDEINAITGSAIQIVLAEEVRTADAEAVVAALGEENGRFPGLQLGDLPCLWIEDNCGGRAIIRFPHGIHEINQTLRTLADITARTKDAREIEELLASRLTENAPARSPALRALLERIPMTKSSERLVAVICGVVFVAAILVIALFISTPTPFQYTIFRIVLALAAAGFVSMTPGFIEAKVGNLVRAGGALAVFVIVYFYAPAAMGAL